MKTCHQNKCFLICIYASLLFATGCANDANSPHTNSSGSAMEGIIRLPGEIVKNSGKGLEDMSETSGYMLEAALGDVNNWPMRIINDTRESFLRPDNLCIMMMATGVTIALHNDGDKKIADKLDDDHFFRGFGDESLNIAGHPWTQFGAAALWYAISKKNDDTFNQQRAKSMLAALSVTGVTTMGLKAIRDNESPNGKDWAWPSGHAASSFTVASMLDEFYGPRVGIPAYALASLISYRMIDSGDHWTSDVIFGAAMGWVVGHTFADRQKQLEVAGFKVMPYTTYVQANNTTVMGVNLVKRF